MRDSSLIALLTLAAATLLLAGCTGDTAVQTARESSAPVDLCAFAAPSGGVSGSVVVEGTVGSPASATFPRPLTISSVDRSVVVEGKGEPLDSTSLVEYAMSVYDAVSGELVQAQGYDGAPSVPVPAVTVGQFLGCAPVGSRVTVAVPETDQGGPTIWVLDVLNALPGRAIGADQQPVEGMPAVTLGEDGRPAVSVPGGAPPTETRLALLKKGEGASVAPGDTVTVHHTGVRWSDGTVFDSSWDKGAPSALVTSGLIAGYREALEGQTVGSQVLVVIPPQAGYGEGQINEEDLIGETLVFVVDVLATAPAA